MAAIFRVGVGRIISINGSNKLLSNPGTAEIKVSIRGIAGKYLRCRKPTVHKPTPWPYKEKGYTLLNYFFDKTTARFDENTKLIVVEGPIAAGKTDFAKELAKDLGMLYYPEANQDMFYINDTGYDMKKLDPQLPESCRSFDIKDFLLNPRHKLSASFQIRQYIVKYSQYIDALAHILSTGQGVVLDRCVYSDFVFTEAMVSEGYMSKGARSVYYDIRKNSISELLRPHLVIYLDVPVNKIQANIKRRHIPSERNSSALTAPYLTVMENTYKQQYLKDISNHSELLIYDWSEGGEVEVVVEDIERIKFTPSDDQDQKFKDWVNDMEEEWAVLRHTYADKKDRLMYYLNVPRFDVPELITEAEDCKEFRDIWFEAPGMRYATGYDPTLGDTGLLFKRKLKHRDTLPLIERRFQQMSEM